MAGDARQSNAEEVRQLAAEKAHCLMAGEKARRLVAGERDHYFDAVEKAHRLDSDSEAGDTREHPEKL